MVRFAWRDVFYRYINLHDKISVRNDRFRRDIEEYGVNSIDIMGWPIFGMFLLFTHDHTFFTMVDIIFEYKPNIFPHNRINLCDDTTWKYLNMYDGYILKKAFEQDVDFEYIRCRYIIDRHDKYPTLCHYFLKQKRHDISIGLLFGNHFKKGITFFEMMKIRLFE